MKPHFVATLVVLWVSGNSQISSPPQKTEKLMHSTLLALAPGLQVTEVALRFSEKSGTWGVYGKVLASFERDGKLVTFFNPELVRRGSAKFNDRERSRFIQRARVVLSSLEAGSKLHLIEARLCPTNSMVGGGAVVLRFCEEQRYPTNGFGNSASVTLDFSTERVVALRLERGWRYLPEAPVITQASAGESAANFARGKLGRKVGKMTGCELRYVVPEHGRWSANGSGGRPPKVCRLAYVVRFDALTVSVDSSTGECIAWSLAK